MYFSTFLQTKIQHFFIYYRKEYDGKFYTNDDYKINAKMVSLKQPLVIRIMYSCTLLWEYQWPKQVKCAKTGK